MENRKFHPTSDPVFAHEKLDVYRLLLEYLELEHQLARAMPTGPAKLQDELDRAADSMMLNFGEAAGKRAGSRDQAIGLDHLALFDDLYTSWSRYRLHPSLLACSYKANFSRRSRLTDFALAKSLPFSIASCPCC
ncbi:MAG: hypothetical protein ACYS47_09640 [Planctomycetota bacterium]|jgi:hypothetical protein